jgi:hypothetical protein
VGTGIGGAAVAAADRTGQLRPGIAVALALATASGILAVAAARRLHEVTEGATPSVL